MTHAAALPRLAASTLSKPSLARSAPQEAASSTPDLELLDATPRARWERAASEAGAPLQQSWAYGEAMAAMGATVVRLRLRDAAAKRDTALIQVILRKLFGKPHLALASRGPVWLAPHSDAAQAAALAQFRAAPALNRPQFGWLRLAIFSPDETTSQAALAAAGLTRVYTGATPIELDIRPEPDAIRAAMQVKWRNRLKAAEKSGFAAQVITPRADDYAWLLEADALQQAIRGYAALPPHFTRLYDEAGGGVRLAIAYEPGVVRRPENAAAAMLFLIHGRRASYHIGWNGEAGRRSGAHNLLLWQSALALRAEGIEAIDLGSTDTLRNAGLARFKIGSGGRLVRLAGAYL